MHIAILVSGLMKEKNESLTLTTINLAEHLAADQNIASEPRSVVIITRNKDNLPPLEKVNGITICRIKSLRKISLYNKLLSFPLAFRKLHRQQQFSIIHGFSASPVLVLRSLLAKWLFAKKAKVIHTLKSYPIKRNILAKKGSWLLSWLGDTQYWLLNFADWITVPTQAHLAKLISRGVNHHKIKVIPSFIDLQKFKPQDKNVLKKKYGYSQDKIVLHYGSLWEIKGTDCLLKAMPAVIRNLPLVKLILIPRNKEQALEKYLPLIKKLGLSTTVQFILDEVKIEDYVNLADLAVFPYPHLEGTEGNPSCLLECLACGTLVITSDLPELREVFFNSAILTKPAAVEELSAAIIEALTNNQPNSANNYSKLAQPGLQLAKQFSINRTSQKFLELYGS
ncbi:MAG TPA: glycosyltransferase family 4 protein [Candidatus Nanoarchaeia archaeon]|nr:glycosyltransferase family 4 protein [Candidatus Nanoarchaeia archaeon]